MLQVSLDHEALKLVFKSLRSFTDNENTFAFETGNMLRGKYSQIKVFELYEFLKSIKDLDLETYFQLEKMIAASQVLPMKVDGGLKVSVAGVPKTKASILNALINSSSQLQLSGIESPYVNKAKQYSETLFEAGETIDKSVKPWFNTNQLHLKRGQVGNWQSILNPFKHSTFSIRLVDAYGLKKPECIAEFVAGLVNRTHQQINLTLITKEEEYSAEKAEKLLNILDDKGYNITFRSVLYGSSASTDIHDRYAVTDCLSIFIGSGFDSVRGNRIYRNCKLAINGKFYAGGKDYQSDLDLLLELENYKSTSAIHANTSKSTNPNIATHPHLR